MIDGQIDLVGSKEEAEKMFEEFVRRFKLEKAVKGVLYQYFMGVYIVPADYVKRSNLKMLGKIEELEEDLEPDTTLGDIPKSEAGEGYR